LYNVLDTAIVATSSNIKSTAAVLRPVLAKLIDNILVIAENVDVQPVNNELPTEVNVLKVDGKSPCIICVLFMKLLLLIVKVTREVCPERFVVPVNSLTNKSIDVAP